MVCQDLRDPEETRAQKLVVQTKTIPNPFHWTLNKVIFEKSVGNCGRWRTAWNSRKPRERGLFDRAIIPCIVLTILALLLLIFIFNVLFGFGIFFLGPVWTVWFNWYSRDAWTKG